MPGGGGGLIFFILHPQHSHPKIIQNTANFCRKTNDVDSDQVWHKPGCTATGMAGGLKFCMKEVEVLYYPSSKKKKGAVTTKLIRVFVFA